MLREPNLASVALADSPSTYVVGTRGPGAGSFFPLLMTEFLFTKHAVMHFVNITMPVDRSEVQRSISGGPRQCPVYRGYLIELPRATPVWSLFPHRPPAPLAHLARTLGQPVADLPVAI